MLFILAQGLTKKRQESSLALADLIAALLL
jgi:hypothetical protein